MTDQTPGSSAPPPPPAGEELVYPTNPPQNPVLVAVLNFFLLGGVGYIIMGQKMKGIVTIIAWVILVCPTFGAGSFLLGVLATIDGYLQAQQLMAGHRVGQWTFFNDHR